MKPSERLVHIAANHVVNPDHSLLDFMILNLPVKVSIWSTRLGKDKTTLRASYMNIFQLIPSSCWTLLTCALAESCWIWEVPWTPVTCSWDRSPPAAPVAAPPGRTGCWTTGTIGLVLKTLPGWPPCWIELPLVPPFWWLPRGPVDWEAWDDPRLKLLPPFTAVPWGEE